MLFSNQAGDKKVLNNLSYGRLPYALSQAAHQAPHWIVFIAEGAEAIANLSAAVRYFLDPAIPVYQFPDWETLPYDHFSPHPDIISERIQLLYDLSVKPRGVLIVSASTCLYKIAPKDYLLQRSFSLEKKSDYDLISLKNHLLNLNYLLVPQVNQPGEFAVRGSILDLFPMGSEQPYRIDFFDEAVDSIRIFDPETQRSSHQVEQIQLLPAKEFPLDKAGIAKFREQWGMYFTGDPLGTDIYPAVKQGQNFPGLEYYLPLFFEKTASIFDYLPAKSLIFITQSLEQDLKKNWHNTQLRFDQYGHDRRKPILAPKEILLSIDEFFGCLKKYQQYQLEFSNTPIINQDNLKGYIEDYSGTVILTAETSGRREVLKELLAKQGIYPVYYETWPEISAHKSREEKSVLLSIAPLEELLIGEDFSLIPEAALFGKRIMQRRLRRRVKVEQDAQVRHLSELTLGAPVVHVEHGVGRYLGLINLKIADQEGEFLCLAYAGEDKIYVPVASLHLISRYSGADLDRAPLNKLGGPEWERSKRRAAEQVRDVAAELLAIYAQRETKTGEPIKALGEDYERFRTQFAFEETPDQELAINNVLSDLSRAKPMDRVVCGDVGFGKTEVALRAAFMAVHSGWQVAVLVPTTLLAQQHYENFCDRFAEFPIRIAQLSRFKTKKEQSLAIEELAAGKIDIVIGTHKLIQADIQYKHLGLVIIDEEHRFGVRQKDQFKALRANVHMLTLTATPIPRTLNMALSGIRDLSIIATPPARRLSVKTFVRPYESALISEAIQRELHRGGQVYYLHNSVDTIQNCFEKLEKLLPEAKIALAHGQMRERELERIMSDFYHKRFNVLICTTIIETGIDIPTANTIIIERADKFGLAQLHQLRGRVGRSHHQAYAFCLLPAEQKIGPDAQKRLEALEQLEDLGSGFTLATHDLEIRGAGELLGDEQSGRMQEIGYQLYMDMLERAVKALQQGEAFTPESMSQNKTLEIDIQIPAFIPQAYVPDVNTRLVLYKRISSMVSEQDLVNLRFEFEDRFGVLPKAAENLFNLGHLRLFAESLKVAKIDGGDKSLRIEFKSNPLIDIKKLIALVQTQSRIYQLDPLQRLKIIKETAPENRIEVLRNTLQALL
ncbi:MAG: transcription-repair coupling factor [Gammaproteobacteria bacterium]